ncbi:hypothetical protein [Chitinilyticum piscinae]|uniref:Uncharacterized protein n=1 Tax=Chitinilyticum piscinae TaxID=2866724 RepID=A0A8J7FKE6_9NEIS|nr:hypothetical protein [Chitinilyticum piscinae]MBE9610863.1 hypothetical protein [Chitinilyticum piscinae]
MWIQVMTLWSLPQQSVELKQGYDSLKTLRVVIRPNHLNKLIYDACELAHRMYELMLLTRPGDLLSYLCVEVDECSDWVRQRVTTYIEQAIQRSNLANDKSVLLPLQVFDGFFCWAGDDTPPEDDAWLSYRESEQFSLLLKQWFAEIQAAQTMLAKGDDLQRHCFYQFKQGTHRLNLLDRKRAIAVVRDASAEPNPDSAYFRKICELLDRKDIRSVTTYSGSYAIFRLLCNKQRQEAYRTGLSPGLAFPINTTESFNLGIRCSAWGAQISFYSEGMGRGDLHIASPCHVSINDTPKNLDYLFKLARYVVCSQSLGTLEGYSVEEGDGWWCYHLIDDARAIAQDEWLVRLNQERV